MKVVILSTISIRVNFILGKFQVIRVNVNTMHFHSGVNRTLEIRQIIGVVFGSEEILEKLRF